MRRRDRRERAARPLFLIALVAAACAGRPVSSSPAPEPPTPAPSASARSSDPPTDSGAPVVVVETDAGSVKPEALPEGCTLPPTETEESSYMASTLSQGRRSVAEWHVAKDGSISLFPSELDDSSASMPKGRPVVLEPAQPPTGSEPAHPPRPRAPSLPDARYALSGSPSRCKLTLPGEKPREVLVQWYNADDRYHRFAVVSPVRTEAWAVVLHQHLFSPGLGWRAATLGDIDGDGRNDLAFVSLGVGTCGGETRPDCALLWIDVIMTSTDTSAPMLALVDGGNLPALTHQIGTEDIEEPSHWRGRIRRGAFEVSVSGPKGKHAWTAALGNGVLTLTSH